MGSFIRSNQGLGISKFLYPRFLFILTFMSLLSPSARAGELRYTGKVFELDTHRAKLLYLYKSESETVDGVTSLDNHFTYPDGKLATHEQITFSKAGELAKYQQEQVQLGAQGSIEVGGGKAQFTWKKDGKVRSATEPVGSDFIVGSQIPHELEVHWPEIMKGATLKRRLAVLERLESVGFEFVKDGEADIDGHKTVSVKMKPSAFLIAALVKPLHFYMSTDGKELLEIKGRTTVKRDQGNGKFGDLDAEIVYTKANGEPLAQPSSSPSAQPSSSPSAQPAGNSK